MKTEIIHFDPDSIRTGCQANLAETLRALADAIELGDIDASFRKIDATGFTSRTDERAHILLTLNILAPIRKLNNHPDELPAPGWKELT